MYSKDVRLPIQMQRAMAAEAESAREAKAKVCTTWLNMKLVFFFELWTQFSELIRGMHICGGYRAGLRRRRAQVQIAVATLRSGKSLRQTVHTHCASVHQAAKLVAALLRVAVVTAGLVEINGSLPLSL